MLCFKKGISLIEVVIIFVIIAGLFFILFSSFRKTNRNNILKNYTDQSVFVLEKARSMTLSSKNDSQHGVHIENDKVILFSGVVYNQSDSNNEEFIFGNDVSITNITLNGGGVDVIFKKLTGETNNYGSFSIHLLSDPPTIKVVNIEQTGIIKKN